MTIAQKFVTRTELKEFFKNLTSNPKIPTFKLDTIIAFPIGQHEYFNYITVEKTKTKEGGILFSVSFKK